MASAQGTATINFGTSPGSQEAQVNITGQGTISATSKAEAFIMADDTSVAHTANDHKYLPLFCGLSCGTPTGAVGFTIYARSMQKLTGDFTVRWVWAD